MKQIVTSEKIRLIIAGCKTDNAVVAALKRHKIRFYIDNDGYNYLNIKIPTKTGKIRIYNEGTKRNSWYTVQTMQAPIKLTYSGIPTYRPSLSIGTPYTENEF